MKGLLSVSVDVAVLQALKNQAIRTGVPVSRIVQRLLVAALDLPQDAPARERSRKEVTVLSALDRLTERATGFENGNPEKGRKTWRADHIAHEAGLFPSQILGTLRGLEHDGELLSDEFTDIEAAKLGKEIRFTEWGRKPKLGKAPANAPAAPEQTSWDD